MSALELTYIFPDGGFTLVLPIFGGTASSIDWGDGSPPTTDDTRTHTYSSAGTYYVSILGTNITHFNYFFESGATGKQYLTECTSFGEIGLTDLYFSFYNTQLLTTVPSSLPTLSTITNMQGLFQSSSPNIDYSNITGWDVSGVQNMQALFYGSTMNVDISGWNVSSVTNMSFMFAENTVFNQPLNGWGSNTSNVTVMDNMFSGAASFNQPIGNWVVSSLQTSRNMFANATNFNQDISNWQVFNLTNASAMFVNATAFNNGGAPGTSSNPLSWGTSTGNLQNVSSIFTSASNFNQDISDWDVSNVTNVRTMFSFTSSFNQNLNNWNLTSLSDATLMFYGAIAYDNGGITLDWTGKIPLLNNMDGMFTSATSFNQIILLDTSNVTNMGGLFYSAQQFNQDISGWDFSSVTIVNSMFAYSLYNHDVSNWNITSLTSMQNMFTRALSFNNGDVPFTGNFLNQISNVTNMKEMFYEAPAFNQDISNWDVSNVTNMESMFYGATAFNNNDAALNWDSKISKVTNMQNMFNGATLFNLDVTNWDVSSVTNMYGMFQNATSFNNNNAILLWGSKTSNVVDMRRMFYQATSFNQPIGGWIVSSVINMEEMFYGASVFNRYLGDWNVSNVINMNNMFNGAVLFDKNLSEWDISNVTDMSGMFQNATGFNNGNTSLGWTSGTNTSKVTDMSYMFKNASSFNQDISNWNVSNVLNMDNMFSGAVVFNKPIGSWDISSVVSMGSMFQNASSFNQPLNLWDISNVEEIVGMFENATAFNQDIGGWNVSNANNFYNILHNATSFNQDISSWNISTTYNISDMLSNSFLSISNYNNALNSWANLTYTGDVEGYLYFGGYGLVYSSSGSAAHDILSQLPPPYTWIFVGDAFVSTDTILTNTGFSLIINAPITPPESEDSYFLSGDYQLFLNDEPFSSVVSYDNSVDSTINFTNLIFAASGNNLPLVLKYITLDGMLGDVNDIATYYFNVFPNMVCFKQDTKILSHRGYITIQNLQKGDLIQTCKDGLKPINMIAKREIHHKASKERITDQLYKYSNKEYRELFEDLVITGCHSILIDNFKDKQQFEKVMNHHNGNYYMTDGKYRLPACLDEKSSVYEKEGKYTIYHIALENDNYLMNYGIFANGLLVESCSKRYLKELSGMTIIE